VNWRTEIKFLISLGETKTLLRDRLDGSCAKLVEVTRSKEPSPTTMLEGTGYRWEKVCERKAESEVM
jgi:hypothetical protein